MGNSTSSNRVDDQRRKRAQIGQLTMPSDLVNGGPTDSNNQKALDNRCSLDVELVHDYDYGSPNMSP